MSLEGNERATKKELLSFIAKEVIPLIAKKEVVSLAIATLLVVIYVALNYLIKDLIYSYFGLAQLIVLLIYAFSIFALVELWEAFRLKWKLQRANQNVEVIRGELLGLTEQINKKLERYKVATEAYIILDCLDDRDAIATRLTRAFTEQPDDTTVLALGSFQEQDVALSVGSILHAKEVSPTISIAVVDTRPPYHVTGRDSGAKTHFYTYPSEQVFDPIIVFSTSIFLAAQGKCIILPVSENIEKSNLELFLGKVLRAAIPTNPLYRKKAEYFSSILHSLSPAILSRMRDAGYSFSANAAELWFADPRRLSDQHLERISNDMDAAFRNFASMTLPVTNEIIASWPLIEASDVALTTSANILDWVRELKNEASRDGRREPLQVYRYCYMDGCHRLEQGRYKVEVRGTKFTDRQTGAERDFSFVMKFLRDNFCDTPPNYMSFVVLTGDKPDEVLGYLNSLADLQDLREIDRAKLLSNWIVFSMGQDDRKLSVLQYEKQENYERDNGERGKFYAFYYKDLCRHPVYVPPDSHLEDYLYYRRLLIKSAKIAMSKFANGSYLENEKAYVLPIKMFFKLHDESKLTLVNR